MFPTERPRRLRASQAIRNLVAESTVVPAQLILPVFVKENLAEPRQIKGLPGVFQHNLETLPTLVDQALAAGIGGIMVFGIPTERDAEGSQACNPNGILNAAIRKVRAQVGERMVVIADLCLDEFTSHGHCGVLAADGSVDNDATLEAYSAMAVELAKAGAHMLGASGMMDGQVGLVRAALDAAGFSNVSILAYAAKYASAFYGPFRDAVESELQGDRKTYQQDPRNLRESLREIRLDVEEGADIVMVKPALSYLDVVREARLSVDIPVAAYIVSGEMAMLEAAAAAGLIERERAILEVLHSVKRAGADIICTYWAIEASALLRSN
ncbi:MAG: porphobilinogen synthase [Micrococcales bacterium]